MDTPSGRVDRRSASATWGWAAVRTQAPSAAAYRATSSGVRSVPTWPRIPETLIMSVSDMWCGVPLNGRGGVR